MNHEISDLSARDGHLTLLSLDRYDAGELDPSGRRHVEAHVEVCEGCRRRLQVVATHEPVLSPPRRASTSTGSATIAYLAVSAGAALAAGVVLALGSAVWPSPQAAREQAIEPTHLASSYTSVAQEYSEPAELDVDLVVRDDTLIATPQGDGWLAIVAVRDDGEADTDGAGEPTVVAVLRSARPMADPVTIALGRSASQRIVALACPGPFAVAAGDPVAIEPGCITRP
jgi:hypothetical protein